YPYAKFLPSYDPGLKLPPLEPFEHVDPGHAALLDANPRSFLDGAKETSLTPKFGSEIEGIQLSQLDARAKGQLALYVAQRGVVVFRDQDFVDQSPEWQLESWGKTFGRLHTHPTSGQPKEYQQFHLVYRDGAGADGPGAASLVRNYYADKLTSTQWHSDVTYEEQPPGLTTLFLYATPESGGDTTYVSQVEAYNRLSPSFRTYLETLLVVHSGQDQADNARRGGGVIKREPVENVHPLVRRHPVTGAKALFVNKGFSRRIVGLKQEESEAILNLLYAHIAQGQDFQVRASWKPRSVVLWDNRITAHSATGDYTPEADGFRHGARITPQAEKPFL
ncbi:alpha-ketoglutarate-dependent sulfonate dioxygenase, partial [Dioszegia hungarica]